jgi:PAS domain S-box-containing protein
MKPPGSCVFERLFEASPQMLCVVGSDGTFRRVNAAWEPVLGYFIGELLSKHILEFVHPEDREAAQREFGRLAAGQSSVRFESRYQHRDGSYRRLSWILAPDHDGSFYATVLDITKTHDSTGLFLQLLDASPDAMIVTKANGTIHLVNGLSELMFLQSATDLIGKPIEVLIPERFRKTHKAHRKAYGDNSPVRPMGAGVELAAVRADGVEFPAEISLAPVKTEEGTLIVCAVRDTTARRKSQDALRRSEEHLDAAARGAAVGIWDWDLRTNRMFYSPTWKTMLGHVESEISDDPSEWESRVHPEDRGRAIDTIRRHLNGESSQHEQEFRLRHKNGSYHWILARGVVIHDALGNPERMVGTHVDVSNLKEMERQLIEHQAELLAAEKIQMELLPKQAPNLPGFDLAGKTCAAEFTAGDMYDYLRLEDGCLGVVVGDVSGHGFSASLLMATTHAYLRSLAASHPDLCELVSLVHAALWREIEEGRFVTLLLARVDPQNHTLTYVNAGHPSGYVLDAKGNVLVSLESSTFPLAALSWISPKEGGPISLHEGELLLLVTDGLLEARSPTGPGFGLQRVLEVVRGCLRDPAAQIVEALHIAVREFTGRERPEDDITIVAVKRPAKPV